MKLSAPVLIRLLAIAALLGYMGFATLTSHNTSAYAQEFSGDWGFSDDSGSTDGTTTTDDSASSEPIDTDNNEDVDSISSSRHVIED